ncbi:MAG: AAA family ATPase [Acidimicrobiales bacterium]
MAASGRGLDLVVGVAGSGKTTVLVAVRETFETAGHRVVGGTATSGQAARTLAEAAGIQSRTVASLLWRLAQPPRPSRPHAGPGPRRGGRGLVRRPAAHRQPPHAAARLAARQRGRAQPARPRPLRDRRPAPRTRDRSRRPALRRRGPDRRPRPQERGQGRDQRARHRHCRRRPRSQRAHGQRPPCPIRRPRPGRRSAGPRLRDDRQSHTGRHQRHGSRLG